MKLFEVNIIMLILEWTLYLYEGIYTTCFPNFAGG